MPHRPLRKIVLPAASDAVYARWLGELEERLADPGADRDRLCRDTLLALSHLGIPAVPKLVTPNAPPDAAGPAT